MFSAAFKTRVACSEPWGEGGQALADDMLRRNIPDRFEMIWRTCSPGHGIQHNGMVSLRHVAVFGQRSDGNSVSRTGLRLQAYDLLSQTGSRFLQRLPNAIQKAVEDASVFMVTHAIA